MNVNKLINITLLKPYFFLLFLAVCAFQVAAQDAPSADAPSADAPQANAPLANAPRASSFFFAPLGDVSLYGRSNMSYGGGFITGLDGVVASGISGIYTVTPGTGGEQRIDALDLTLFVRLYFRINRPCAGPFVQLNAGAVVFSLGKEMSIPAPSGMVSAGLTLGWRIPLGSYIFLEPALRAGYPYIGGASLSLGFRL